MRIVPHAHLERANARFVTVETLALDLAGPLAAGVLFLLAPWAPFAVSAACFLIAAAIVSTISTPPVAGSADAVDADRDHADRHHADRQRTGYAFCIG